MPSRSRKSRIPSVGDVFRIKLESGYWGFGIVAVGMDCAFFDFRDKNSPSIDEIVCKPVAFRVFVAWDSFKNKSWEWIGRAPVQGALAEPKEYWHQSIGSNDIFRVKAGAYTLSTEADILGLEQYSIWFDAHVESRLNDHFAGRPNAIHQAMSRVKHYDPLTGQPLN